MHVSNVQLYIRLGSFTRWIFAQPSVKSPLYPSSAFLDQGYLQAVLGVAGCLLSLFCSACNGFSLSGFPSQKKDRRNLCDAFQVTDRSRDWTVIFQVLIKHPTKESQSNPGTWYKKFLFTNMKGTQISAITFSAIEHFDRIFQPFKRYYVTSASVKVADPRYKVGEYNYTWTLYPRTHVQLLHDPVPHVCPYSFDCMNFSEMFRVADHDVSAVKGLIVHAYPIPHATKPFVREYILIDQEKQPMVLRLWDDLLNEGETRIIEKLPQPTFIVGLDLKVTTFNGLSLTTGFNPYFLIDPPLREKEPLVAWYNEHAEEVGQLIEAKAYKSTDILLPPPAAADVVPIRDVSTSIETLKTAWAAATIHLMPAQERLWYNVCDKCKKTVNLPIGSNLPCMYCHKEMDVEPRCNVHVFLNDESGTLSATLSSTTAENFIKFTAAELVEAYEKNAPLNDEIARKIDKKPVLCFLKYYDRSFKGKVERTYPILKIYTQEEANSAQVQTASSLPSAALTSTLEGSASVSAEIEQQLFSPSTKKVIEEIATTVAMDQGTKLPSASTKRGIMFGDSSDEKQDLLISEKVPSPTHESVVPNSGPESPVKKLKNRANDN